MPDHVLLTAASHAGTRVRHERGAGLGDAVMSCLTVPDEFRRVQNEYTILFRRNLAEGTTVALALLGFENGENLYLVDGRWDARYVPLAMEIQPLLIGPPPPGSEGGQVHIDMASPRLSDAEGTRLFDPDGRPSTFLEDRIEKLGALDTGYRQSAGFFAALQRYDLLEPLTVEVTLDDGSTNRLIDFHVIDEERLQDLGGAELDDLHCEGHLMPIFMALASQSNLAALIARKNRAMGLG